MKHGVQMLTDQQVEDLKREAYEAGYDDGYWVGRDSGFDEGYTTGVDSAQA